MEREDAAFESFVPPWWAAGTHGQTLAGHLLRRVHCRGQGERERLETQDGDFLVLEWFGGMPPRAAPIATAPLVLLLHGLEGSSRSGYIVSLAQALAAAGCAAVALNFRGCSGEPNRLPRAYHAGETGDLSFVVATLAQRFPGRPLGVVGFSLGGNVVLRWLGEQGREAAATVRAAAAVSVPYDLARGADHSMSGAGRPYALRLIAELRAKARAKAALVAGRVDLERTLRARTFREFDEAFTAPLHGFRDADDYYTRGSSAPWLSGIAVPTLAIHALDDPFLPSAALPLAALRANPAITLALSDRGGHVGFVAGSPWSPRFLAEQRLARFFAATLR
ncbi:MAG: alpha/beta fold hydrolase [Planctomycetes bacterium]|nr:alpha/beta fold hydrolase [Planctomycetota bacterium]